MRGDEWYDAVLALMTPGGTGADVILSAMLARPEWHQRAACRGQGTADHFPVRGSSTMAARATCAGCTAREECLAVALADPDLQGVWGGTSERERRIMRRDAKIPRCAAGDPADGLTGMGASDGEPPRGRPPVLVGAGGLSLVTL